MTGNKENTKSELLLDKGMEILWSRGYNGTSVNDIVKSADVPKGSFYFYFDSKEDFAVKALWRYFDKMFTPALAIMNDTSIPAKERLIKIFEYRVDTLKNELDCQMGCMASNLGNEVSEHNEKIRNTVVEIHAKVVDSMVQLAEEAQRDGDIAASVNVRDLIEFIQDAGKGAMITMKEMKNSYPVDNFMSMVKNVLLK